VADRGGAILGSPIARVMSKPLTVISPSATIWDAVTLMARADIRHLPVVEKGALVGILTERDVFRLILAQQNLLLESVSDSLPSVTRDQLRGLVGRYGLSTPPGKASS
ncbi:MAG: CBS domain-containing protein, partial [Nitrososphaerota archaeon]|nr:CBS domain-containing protein [Nitrososphaerota archaeon]